MPDLSALVELSPMMLLWLFINGLMWVVRNKVAAIDNKHIPIMAMVIGAACYPLMADPGKAIFTVRCPICLQVFQGAVLGLAAVGTNQLFRQYLGKVGITLDEPEQSKTETKQ